MSSATILFCDVVGFSRKSNKLQRIIVESLTAEVAYFVRRYQLKPFQQTEIIALPTGDGIAVAYIHSTNQSWQAESIVQLSFSLHAWAHKQRSISEAVKLRIGIHTGAVDFVVDINGNTNICGDSINIAQRVMDAANPTQTLISDGALRYYFGTDQEPICFDLDGVNYTASASRPIDTYAKHNVRLTVHSLRLEAEQDWYCSADPYAKNLMLISQTPLPKDLVGDFSDRFQMAQEIALVQINGERLLNALHSGAIQFAQKLERLWVLMPAIDQIDDNNFGAIASGERDMRKVIAAWKEWLTTFAAERPSLDARLLLMHQPSYFGASYLNWSRPGGRIHISPYIWNRPATICPGYDLDWIGGEIPAVYQAYVGGLEHLCSTCQRAY